MLLRGMEIEALDEKLLQPNLSCLKYPEYGHTALLPWEIEERQGAARSVHSHYGFWPSSLKVVSKSRPGFASHTQAKHKAGTKLPSLERVACNPYLALVVLLQSLGKQR